MDLMSWLGESRVLEGVEGVRAVFEEAGDELDGVGAVLEDLVSQFETVADLALGQPVDLEDRVDELVLADVDACEFAQRLVEVPQELVSEEADLLLLVARVCEELFQRVCFLLDEEELEADKVFVW
jgi:hypothetical protein